MLLVAVVVAVAVGVGVAWRKDRAIPAPSTTSPKLTAATVSSLAQAVTPDLVDIAAVASATGEHAAATGMVLTSTGEVLTNNHVIDGATRISAVDLGNGQTYSATVLGYSRSQDLALLQLSGAYGLAAIPSTAAPALEVGDRVVAVGNAGGVGGTPSAVTGSVTDLSASVVASDPATGIPEDLAQMIESNAPIAPGDSGGPLLATNGVVVAMDTAGSADAGALGTPRAYAIPISRALAFAHQVAADVATPTVHLGPTVAIGVEVADSASGAGAYVNAVLAGSPAASAGIRAGDTITSFAGQPVATPLTLTSLLQDYAPNESVAIAWIGPSGARHSTTLQLSAGPSQ